MKNANTLLLYGVNDPITAQSTPDYHGGVFDSGWSCAQWMLWHKALVKAIGRKAANDKFIEHWDKQSTFDTQYNFCKYDSDFVGYFKSQGLNVGHVISNLVNVGSDVIDSTTDAVEDLADGVSSTAKAVSIVVPLLVVGVGYYLYKNYIKGNKQIKVKGVTI